MGANRRDSTSATCACFALICWLIVEADFSEQVRGCLIRKRLEEKEALEQRQRLLDEKLQHELLQKDQNEVISDGGDPDMPYPREEAILQSKKRKVSCQQGSRRC